MQPLTSFTIESAMAVLDKPYRGIPFDAIEFLYNHPSDERLQQAILFNLCYAYVDDVQSDPETEIFTNSALWYAIVAENHLSPELIDPIMLLLSTTNEDWVLLTEQAAYVNCLLAEKHPDVTVPKALYVIDQLAGKRADVPYLYLFDVLFFADREKHKNQILNILAKAPFPYFDAFAVHVAYMQMREAIPVIKGILTRHLERYPNDSITSNELKYGIRLLETGKVEHPEVEVPYSRFRGNWKEYYQSQVNYFIEDFDHPDTDDDDPDEALDEYADDWEAFEYSDHAKPAALPPPVGCNALCPCGSGLKYKKCCGRDN